MITDAKDIMALRQNRHMIRNYNKSKEYKLAASISPDIYDAMAALAFTHEELRPVREDPVLLDPHFRPGNFLNTIRILASTVIVNDRILSLVSCIIYLIISYLIFNKYITKVS